MDDFDIYADLPDFAWLKQEYEADVEIKDLATSEEDITELKTKLFKLEKVHKLVLSHYSSLWKTAKQERKRMERQIAELRSQLDNFTFKRNPRYNCVAPPFVSVQPLIVHPPSVLPAPTKHQYNYPPPLMSQAPFSEQQTTRNSHSYPCQPPAPLACGSEQQWIQQELKTKEHILDNKPAVPSNVVITPENSHSSDGSDDDIVKKSEYRSTVYGERLRRKLLEERRNAIKQKKEASLSEQKVNKNNLEDQETRERETLGEIKRAYDLKDENTGSMTKQRVVRTVTEENNNKKSNEVEEKNGQNLKSQNEINGTKSTKVSSTNAKIKRERDLSKIKQDKELNTERETERRSKEEELVKAHLEKYEKRKSEEEIEKRRKNQEFERRKKDELDKRKREEINERKIEKGVEKRKKQDIDRQSKGEEIDGRKTRNITARRRNERELNLLRGNEIIEKQREEEQNLTKFEEIEKNRNEKKLEELNEEGKWIEKEMNTMKNEKTEQADKPEPLKHTLCKEQCNGKKTQDHIKQPKENVKDIKQSQESRCDSRRNDNFKAGGRSSRNGTSRIRNQCQRTTGNRRNVYHEHPSSKYDRHQDNHIHYDKHSGSRSRRDQADNEREGRKNSYRNKCRNRRSPSVHRRSNEGKNNYSPKGIKLQERHYNNHDKLKNPETDMKNNIKVRSPKRRRQIKFDEISPKNNKRRKISPETDFDVTSKSNSNAHGQSNALLNGNLDESNYKDNHGISSSFMKHTVDGVILSSGNTCIVPVDDKFGHITNITSVKDKFKEEKAESLDIVQDKTFNKLTGPKEALKANCKKENQEIDNSSKDQGILTDSQTDKAKSIDYYAVKMKTLISELFDESQETTVDTLANPNNFKKLDESLDETVLSELEEGQITDSDDSMTSENLPNSGCSLSTNEKIAKMNSCDKNGFAIRKSKKKLPTSLQNSMEIALKRVSEEKVSILYSMLTQSKNNVNEENTKDKLYEQASNKKDAIYEDNKKSETCNEIVNKTDNTSSSSSSSSSRWSSQIVKEKRKKDDFNESGGIDRFKKMKKNALAEVNDNETISNKRDAIYSTIMEKEKECNSKKNHDDVEVGKINLGNSMSGVFVPAGSNILMEQPLKNWTKINNSENKIDMQAKLNIKRTELERNSTKHTCVKENLKVNSKPNIKLLEIPFQVEGAKYIVTTSQTKISSTAVKKVIVVRRRRRPVQLSDSPPVVVINNANKTS